MTELCGQGTIGWSDQDCGEVDRSDRVIRVYGESVVNRRIKGSVQGVSED